MPTRLFSDLVNRLAPSVPGCPQPVMLTYIRDAAIDACERTLAWRYEQPDIRLTPGVYDYPFEPPDNTEVHAVLTVSVNGNRVDPATLEQVHARYPKYPDSSTGEQSTPQYLVYIDPDTFYLAPPPDSTVDYDLRMIIALKPLRNVTGMDQTIMDDLETVIMHGALQHLLVLPDRTWSDRELAAYHAKQFIFKVTERRARTNVGSGRATMTVRNVAFA